MVCNKPHITQPQILYHGILCWALGFYTKQWSACLPIFFRIYFHYPKVYNSFFYGLLEQNHDKNNLRKEELLGSQLPGMFSPGLEVITLELGHLVTSHLQLGSRDW